MKVTFDANIFIARKLQLSDLPSGFYLSAVVLQELVAGASDRSEGVVIVTDNAGDFDKIRPLCAAKTVSGEDYFGTPPD